jgi:hypothetical protein
MRIVICRSCTAPQPLTPHDGGTLKSWGCYRQVFFATRDSSTSSNSEASDLDSVANALMIGNGGVVIHFIRADVMESVVEESSFGFELHQSGAIVLAEFGKGLRMCRTIRHPVRVTVLPVKRPKQLCLVAN